MRRCPASRSLRLAAQMALALGAWRASLAAAPATRLLFTSRGQTGLADAGTGEVRMLAFSAPRQVTWQPGPCFSDGRSLVVLSMEPRRDGPGRPFDEYYTQTPTHLWRYDLDTGQLGDELLARHKLATFVTPQLLVSDERLLVQVVRERVGQILSVKLDGTDARPFTRAGEGLPDQASVRGSVADLGDQLVVAPAPRRAPHRFPRPRRRRRRQRIGPARPPAGLGCGSRHRPGIGPRSPRPENRPEPLPSPHSGRGRTGRTGRVRSRS